MNRSRWVLAVGGIAGLLAVCLVVTPIVRDQLLQWTRVWLERSDGADLAAKLSSTDSFLEYCATHPDQVALASWEIGDQADGIAYNAERPQPASNANALLVLAAYAHQADPEGHAQTPVTLEQWERYFLPGTDGGAHQAALLDARASGALRDGKEGSLFAGASAAAPEPDAQTKLDDVVRAMIRHADPAATDLLIEHIGREHLTERVQGLGFSADAVPLPAAGMTLSLLDDAAAPELLARFRAQQRSVYVDATWQRFAKLRDDGEFRARSLDRLGRRGIDFSLRETAELTAAFSPRGAAADYARLMQQVVNGELQGAEYMRTQLEQLSAARHIDGEELDSFGGLRGSQPGMYASVLYGRVRGTNQTRVMTLMLRKLPIGVWLHLSSGYLLRRFERELLSDPAFFDRVRTRLNPPANAEISSEAQTAVDMHSGHNDIAR